MNKCMLTIWGRELECNIIYECYPGEVILESQKHAFKWLTNTNIIEESLEYVKEYVKKTAGSKIDGSIDNIFKYVMPKSIFVPHDSKKPKIALLCNYKFDLEHGLAVVFENSQYKEVGEKDIIL